VLETFTGIKLVYCYDCIEMFLRLEVILCTAQRSVLCNGEPESEIGPNIVNTKDKGKAVPLQAWSSPEGSRKLKFPDYMTTEEDGGKVVSLMHQPPLPPGSAPGIHFCYRVSRPEDHSAIGRIMSMKNSSDTIWNRTSDLPICSTAR